MQEPLKREGGLVRFGVSMSVDLLERFDRLIEAKGYNNRSEAIRDMVRRGLIEQEWEQGDREVAGTITVLYRHHTGGLAEVLTELQHQYHRAIISTMHVHLDQHNCLEVLVVRGRPAEVRAIADRIASVRGVIQSHLTMASTGRELC